MSQLASGFLEQQLGVAQALSPFKVRISKDDTNHTRMVAGLNHSYLSIDFYSAVT